MKRLAARVGAPARRAGMLIALFASGPSACDPVNLTEETPLPPTDAPQAPQPDAGSSPDAGRNPLPEIEALLAQQEPRGFQGAVLVEVAGERVIDAGFGALSASSTRAPDAQTAFDCGSIMKDVTLSLLLLLEQDGLLSRSQTLGEFFPEAPEVWRPVTLEQVATHSAGFDEYHDTEGDFEAMDRETALATIFAQEPLFEPGTDSAYSSSGYTLLAAVIEQVTGADFAAVARERVFAPLVMTRSGFHGDPLWGDGNVAIGSGADVFQDNDPSRWPAPSWALLGNGGLVSTLDDLLRLTLAFDDEALFRAPARAALHPPDPGVSIGGEPLYAYAGGNDFGFNAVVLQVPGDATHVIAASHVSSAVDVEALALDILTTLYGEPPTLSEL